MKKYLSLSLAILMIILCTACGASAKATDNGAPMEMYSSSSSVAFDTMESPEYAVEEESFSTGAIKGEGGATVNTSKPMAPNAENTQPSVSEKIVYRFSLDIETLEYDKTMDELEALITKYGGFIENSESYGKSINSNRKPRRNSYIVAKIPTASKNSFAEDLTSIGNITRESKSAENVTRQYYDLESRIQSLEIQQERLLDILSKAKTVEEILQVENELSNVRYKLESYTTDIKQLEHLTAYSTYNINISEVIEYSDEPIYNPNFFERMGKDIENSFESFLDFLEGLLTVIIFLFPYLVIVAVVLVIVLFLVKRKRKNKIDKGE